MKTILKFIGIVALNLAVLIVLDRFGINPRFWMIMM